MRQRLAAFLAPEAGDQPTPVHPVSAAAVPVTPQTDFLKTYPQLVANLRANLPEEEAFAQAVGGEFETMGKLERALLEQFGLAPQHFVVDVGCGSGRLAYQLRDISRLQYLGTDVVPELLGRAQAICRRPDWQFRQTNGAIIPAEDNSADFVCLFSVMTHLTHEDSFRYVREAARVLKPGGLLVFSFLEFHIYCHWEVFRHSVDRGQPGDHLNQFVDRAGIQAWAHHAGLDVKAIFDGDKPHIPLEEDLRWEDGRVMQGLGNLGQSVAILSKPLVPSSGRSN